MRPFDRKKILLILVSLIQTSCCTPVPDYFLCVNNTNEKIACIYERKTKAPGFRKYAWKCDTTIIEPHDSAEMRFGVASVKYLEKYDNDAHPGSVLMAHNMSYLSFKGNSHEVTISGSEPIRNFFQNHVLNFWIIRYDINNTSELEDLNMYNDTLIHNK